MGLDQFAFSVSPTGEKKEIAYWRKHPNLHGWMEELWYDKGCPQAYELPGAKEDAEQPPMPAGTSAAMFDGANPEQPAAIVANPLTEHDLTDINENVRRRPMTFNTVPLELTEKDLTALEEAVQTSQLPPTEGFFFGENADEHYREDDIKFIAAAREELAAGNRVYYDSWW